ncbi:MAG TPA: hypothetical protein EYP57_02945, partial [Thermodesulfobacteriaceae bacterium]|nr:hypothetical protein [Thermodesulfobacteriaceae bacterium]
MLSMKSDSVGSRPLVAVLLLVFLLSVSGLAWASSEAGHGAASGREAPVAAGEVVNGGHGDAAGHGAGEAGGHGEGAHHGITHSQVMMFVWHCLSFSILALVLVKFLRKPISDGLKGRTESIKAGFEELEARRTEAERRYAEYERKLSNLDAEADRILKVFTEQGIAEKEKII